MADLSNTLASLSSSLDDVESALEGLLSRPLQESLDGQSDPIERAKLLFWIAYTIHSCSWGACPSLCTQGCLSDQDSVYTKLRAVDPEEHGVLQELVRTSFLSKSCVDLGYR